LVYTEREIRNIFFESSRLEKTCLAATKLNKLIEEKKYKTIEVNSTLNPRNISSEVTSKNASNEGKA